LFSLQFQAAPKYAMRYAMQFQAVFSLQFQAP